MAEAAAAQQLPERPPLFRALAIGNIFKPTLPTNDPNLQVENIVYEYDLVRRYYAAMFAIFTNISWSVLFILTNEKAKGLKSSTRISMGVGSFGVNFSYLLLCFFIYDFETPQPGRFRALLANAEHHDGCVAIFKVFMEILFSGSSCTFLVMLGTGDNNLWMLVTGFILGLNCIFISVIMRTMSFTPIQVVAGCLMSLGVSMENSMGSAIGPFFAVIICLLRMFLEWRDLKAKKTPYGVVGVHGPVPH